MTASSLPVPEPLARARVYAFLAEVFDSHPDPQSASALRSLATELGLPFPDPLPADDLDREYMELFVVPNPRYVAPYESVFRDEWDLPAPRRGSNPSESGQKIKGLLMGESTVKVHHYFLRANIVPAHGLPDHISNELRLLAYLSEREAVAGSEEAEALAQMQALFQREHLLQWIGQLRERIEQRERLGYYSAAVRIVESLLVERAEPVASPPSPAPAREPVPAPRTSRCPFHARN